jgi:hypothetical protein
MKKSQERLVLQEMKLQESQQAAEELAVSLEAKQRQLDVKLKELERIRNSKMLSEGSMGSMSM